MEKSFRKIANEFLTELVMEQGTCSPYGNAGVIKHVLVCDCPLLNNEGEEDKMIISKLFVMEHPNKKLNVSVCSQDYYTKSLDKYEDDYVRLIIRSICAALNLNSLWSAKLAQG